MIHDHIEQYYTSLELCGRNPSKKLSEAPHRLEYILLPAGWFEVVCSKLNLRCFSVDGSTAAVLFQASRVWRLWDTVRWLGTCICRSYMLFVCKYDWRAFVLCKLARAIAANAFAAAEKTLGSRKRPDVNILAEYGRVLRIEQKRKPELRNACGFL